MTTRTTALADGVLENRGGQQVLCFQRHLAHPITRVWAALTDPAELLGWWGEAEVDLVEGGKFILRWLNADEHDQRFVMHATITRLEPPHLLETQGDAHGVLRWELCPEANGTLLTFSSSLALPEAYRTKTLAGRHYHLDALATVLAGQTVDLVRLPNERWEHIHALYRARYPEAKRTARG
jgi:uncharacterized protein YndB with AHSA1/START domain